MATVTNLHEFRAARLPLRAGGTGPGLPPCADAPDSRTAVSPAAVRPSLCVGDQVIDRDTGTIAVVTVIEYGPHGAPSMVRVMLQHGSAWRRADKVERIWR